jgi:predicted GIY-YIG superfamily endonuclease
MRSFDGFELVYSEEFGTKSEAMKREAEIKKWPKMKKEDLILRYN